MEGGRGCCLFYILHCLHFFSSPARSSIHRFTRPSSHLAIRQPIRVSFDTNKNKWGPFFFFSKSLQVLLWFPLGGDFKAFL